MESRQRRRSRFKPYRQRGWLRLALLLLLLSAATAALLAGCATTAPPRTQTELCQIFDERREWYRQARSAEQRWGTPIAIKMAFVQQESAFDARARPRRQRVLGVFPGRPMSTAYGYAQAIDAAWDDYRAATGRRFARRNHMADALDFIGWYNDVSHRRLGIPLTDARHLYYAYHEGHAGYRLGNWQEKAWLQGVAGRVEERARAYQRQLAQCESRLNRRWWLGG